MLVRLNGKSVYRFFFPLSPCTLFFSFTSLICPNEQFDAMLYLFHFLLPLYFQQSTLNGQQTISRICLFLFCRTVIHRNASVDKMCSRDKLDHRKIVKKLCICKFCNIDPWNWSKDILQYIIKKELKRIYRFSLKKSSLKMSKVNIFLKL